VKPLIVTFILSLALCLSVSAQKWLWVSKDADDTSGNTQSGGDALAITTDRWGNMIEGGEFIGKVSFGSHNIVSSSKYIGGLYVAKFDNNGKALWVVGSTSPNTLCNATVISVATDNLGNIYVTGTFSDTVTIGSTTLTTPEYDYDFFIAKLDANGNFLWAKEAKRYGGSGFSWGNGIATDAAGNAYATGTYLDTVSFGSYTLVSPNGGVFLVKYDSGGNVIWVKSSAGHPVISFFIQDEPNIAIDFAGDVYITGTYKDTVIFNPVTLTADSIDNFVVKYDSGGNVLWGRTATENGIAYAEGQAITCDSAGGVYVAGTFIDSLSFGPFKLGTVGLYSQAYVVKYNSTGNVIWAKGSSGYLNNVFVYSISAGRHYDFYLCGTFSDTINFNGISLTSNNSQPSFLFRFDSSGNALCGTALNNFNDDNNAIAADPIADDAFFTGDVGGFSYDTCRFGDTVISDPGTEWAFQGKWSCVCSISHAEIRPDTICAGNSIILNSSKGGITYSWVPPNGLNLTTVANPIATLSVSTNYTVTIKSGACIVQDTVTVIVNPLPNVNACCSTTVEAGNSAVLNLSPLAKNDSYSWVPSYGLSCTNCSNPVASPLISTTYFVTITDSLGCYKTDTVTIDVNCGNVFIPDAFSPNGDGANDVLYVRGDCIKTMDFVIYDRWGNKMFESNSPSIGWDGTYNGKAMNTGTYVYLLNAEMYNGTSYGKKGNVALVR